MYIDFVASWQLNFTMGVKLCKLNIYTLERGQCTEDTKCANCNLLLHANCQILSLFVSSVHCPLSSQYIFNLHILIPIVKFNCQESTKSIYIITLSYNEEAKIGKKGQCT